MDGRRLRQGLRRAGRLRCPRCGEGAIFEGPFRTRETCPVCGLRFEREPGYFVGAIYLNYGVTVGIALAGYFLLDAWRAPGIGWQLALWMPFAAAFPLWAFRYSKALWLALDHLVDPSDPGSSSATPPTSR